MYTHYKDSEEITDKHKKFLEELKETEAERWIKNNKLKRLDDKHKINI